MTRLNMFLALFIFAFVEAAQAQSAHVLGQVICNTLSCQLEGAKIVGEIDLSTTDKVRQLLDQARERGAREKKRTYSLRLSVDSGGGSVIAAMAIGRILREDRVSVSLGYDDKCYSSCVLLLAGAVSRIIRSKAVGIHRPSYVGLPDDIAPNKVKERYEQLLQAIRSYLREMNVSERLADAMFRVAPEDIRLLSSAELESYGLTQSDPVEAEMRNLESTKLFGLDRREYLRRKALSASRCGPIKDTLQYFACDEAIKKTGTAP